MRTLLVLTMLVAAAPPVAGQKKMVMPSTGKASVGVKLIQRAQAALGGAQKLAAVRDFVELCEIYAVTPRGPVRVKQGTMWLAPGYFRQATESSAGRVEMFYDGNSGWYSTPDGTTVVPPKVAAQVRGVVFRIPYTLLLSDRLPGRTITAIGSHAVEIRGGSGLQVRVRFNPETGLPVTYEFEAAGAAGERTSTTHTYSNFRTVNGLVVPAKMVMHQNGRKIADVEIVKTRINSGLTVAALALKL
ncbi:MAG TPA: hypothetical protein VES20_09340 [Bryobacteraceae bacterium]|nr:hypothetical protein [Bryobacteraceae bacterium]